MKLIANNDHSTLGKGQKTLEIPNEADPRAFDLAGVARIDLHFPKFTDGRAYSQAFLLRRRLGFRGEIRATGDVLIDQLVQMQRSGFDAAVLREGVDASAAQRQFERFTAFYQGDAIHPQPHFYQDRPMTTSSAHPLPASVTAATAIDIHARASATFDAKLAETLDLLRDAAQRAPATQASSLGAEDMVITHLINAHALPISVFVLETGALHAETLALLEHLQTQQAAHPHAPLTVYRPVQTSVVQFVTREGPQAMYRSIDLRKACCGIRKMEPLGRALAGQKAWLTGLRREQSGARAEVPLIDSAELTTKGLLKYNPLANWTWGDVWHYIALHQVAYNPLHDHHFPSIGCAPCTRAISLGEDFRAGRWWWEDEAAKECGLHVTKEVERSA